MPLIQSMMCKLKIGKSTSQWNKEDSRRHSPEQGLRLGLGRTVKVTAIKNLGTVLRVTDLTSFSLRIHGTPAQVLDFVLQHLKGTTQHLTFSLSMKPLVPTTSHQPYTSARKKCGFYGMKWWNLATKLLRCTTGTLQKYLLLASQFTRYQNPSSYWSPSYAAQSVYFDSLCTAGSTRQRMLMEYAVLLDQKRNGLQVSNTASSIRKTKCRKLQDLSQQVQNRSTSVKTQTQLSPIRFFLEHFTSFWQPTVQPSSRACMGGVHGRMLQEKILGCNRIQQYRIYGLKLWCLVLGGGIHPAVRGMVSQYGVTESVQNWELDLGFSSWVCQLLCDLSEPHLPYLYNKDNSIYLIGWIAKMK